jgi:hypothetical protein
MTQVTREQAIKFWQQRNKLASITEACNWADAVGEFLAQAAPSPPLTPALNKVIASLKKARALHVGRPCRHSEDEEMLKHIDEALLALELKRGDEE